MSRKNDLLYRSNQDGTYRIRFCDDVGHQHYHDHLDGICAFLHDHDQRTDDLASFCCDEVWWAIQKKKKKIGKLKHQYVNIH